MGMFSGPAHGSAAWPRLNVASGQIGGRIAGDGPCASGRLRNGSRSLTGHCTSVALCTKPLIRVCPVPSGYAESVHSHCNVAVFAQVPTTIRTQPLTETTLVFHIQII